MKPKVTVDKTKIIATLGPACSQEDTIKKMVLAGADVFRINFSHGKHQEIINMVEIINKINRELGTHVALLADLQGPKIRTGEMENGEIMLESGQEIILTSENIVGTPSKISISYQNMAQDVKPGEQILLDDGKLLLQVVESRGHNEVLAKVIFGGILKPRKGVNLPNTQVSIPSLTLKDREDLDFALTLGIHWVALSFVRKASDIYELREVIQKHTVKNKPLIIAKIEKPEALLQIDEIITASDALMVARGDLGVETPLQNVPLTQKMLVKKCLKASKPIIIATQMMEGMINNFRPTRAEVNDVANSVMDGADALMLSGETSVGQFPVQVVETMHNIISYVEEYEDIYYKHSKPENPHSERYLSDSIIFNACESAQQIDASAIVAMTHTGYSAFNIASQRPRSNIFIFTNNKFVLSQLNLVWGIRGFLFGEIAGTNETINRMNEILVQKKLVAPGELLVNVASIPMNETGKTNMIKFSNA